MTAIFDYKLHGRSTDEILIESFQAGNGEAFDVIVKRHGEWAYKRAFRLTRNAEDAADVTAETFFRAFRSLKVFRCTCSIRSWLYVITTNAFLDHKRRKTANFTLSFEAKTSGEEEELEFLSTAPEETAYDLMLSSCRLAAIAEGVKRLPVPDRVVLTMFYGEEKSYGEIADSLCLPLGTVKSRLSRARLRLRERLEPAGELFAVGA